MTTTTFNNHSLYLILLISITHFIIYYRIITVGFVENATALGESGAGDLILKVIKMHMDKQDLVLAGLKAMNAICFHNRENSLRCISHRAYELIIAGSSLPPTQPYHNTLN